MDVNELLREGHKLQLERANRVEMSGDDYREMKRKADAFDYIEQYHTSSGGLHMNGMHAIVLGRCVGEGRTLLDAIESRRAERTRE